MAIAESFREALLRETREELAKADAKASILLAASGIALAALLTVGSSASWYPPRLTHQAARVLAWAAIALTVLGICSVGAAVKPRLRARRANRGEPHYFGDVEAYWPRWWERRGRDELLTARRRELARALNSMASPAQHEDRLDDQIWTLSHIA